jgi:hypothetical protein
MENYCNYFPHFSNVRHDRRIRRMEKEIGLEAYAIYFKLLEILREQIDFRYPMDDLDLLADEIGSSEQKTRVVICNYQLFEVDDQNRFFSAAFIESMQPYLKMKVQRSEAGRKSGESRSAKSLDIKEIERPFNDRSTTVQRVLNENEQSKVKESKVNESKIDIYIGAKDFNWFKSQFDEIYIDQMKVHYRDKNFDEAISDAYAWLISKDEIKHADKGRCRSAFITFLKNQRPAPKTKNHNVNEDEFLKKLNQMQ